MGAIVELRQVTKIYEGKNKKKTVAVDAIDLSVQSGELFGLLGPNGAGKTTTLNICTTRSSLTSGSAFMGHAVSSSTVAKLVLLNPLVYVSEGMRATLTAQVPHLSLLVATAALSLVLIVTTVIGVRGFMRRVTS